MSAATLLDDELSASGQAAVGGRYVVKPAPQREPPFDDELPARHLTVVGPLDRPLPFDSADPIAPSALRLQTDSDPFGVQPTGRQDLPELAAFARRLVIAIIETATGRRPAAQLRQHTAPAVLAGLARDAGKITRLGSAQRPATLHSLHFAEPADGVAEIAAIVRVGDRFRALALRLEGLDGRWRCVRLQIG
jgi:hypothetical protein